MSEQKKRFRWVPHIIRHDFMRKFFALIFAMLVTATVYSDKRKHEDEIFVIHNVQPTLSLERGFIWKTRNLQEVSLSVRGPRAKLFDLKPEDFIIDYKIGEQEYQNRNKNGTQFVTLKATDVRCRHPRGALLQVVEVSPSEYAFEIDKIGIETLKVKPVFDTEGARYQVESYKILDDKTTVEVSGPLSVLQTYKKAGKAIQTKEIPLKNYVADFTTIIDLKPIDRLTFGSDSVTVAVKLKKVSRKRLEMSQVSFVLPPEKAEQLTVEKFEVPTFKVTISGEVDSLDLISTKDLLLYVEFSENTTAGTYKNVPVRCSFKKPGITGITSVTVQPMVIPEITLKERPAPVAVVPQPEVKKTEVKQPEVKKPEVKQPEAKKPEVKQPEAKKPEVKQPEAKKPEVKK